MIGKRHIRALLRQILCKIHIRNHSNLDVIVAKRPDTKVFLKERYEVLDSRLLEALQEEANYPIGGRNPSSGTRISIELAARVCRRLTRMFVPDSPSDAAAFSAAWLFSIWSEICVIYPIRHLARHIHDKFGKRIIIIPIHTGEITCLSHWAQSQLEPIVLARELRRRGAAVFLLADSEELAGRFLSGRSNLNFIPDRAWWRSDVAARVPSKRVERIFCGNGMRDPGAIKASIGNAAIVGNARDSNSADDILLWGKADNGQQISLNFRMVTDCREFAIFAPSGSIPDLAHGFFQLVGGTSKAALATAHRAVAATGAREVHISDHLFFESALISHAVAAAGGAIYVWPHSSNAGHVPFHKHAAIAGVTAMTSSAAQAWARCVDSARIHVDSSLMLAKPQGGRPYCADEPVHVVVFAGAHRLNRMPVLDNARQEQALRRFYSALGSLPDRFRVLVKPKAYWEPADWMERSFPSGHKFIFTDQTANELDLPNMIFATVSFGSTALLEGIGRGIPALIMREFPVSDYTALNAEHSQVGDLEFVMKQIRACEDQSHYEMMVQRNLNWFETETYFPSH
ncbi:hypothetical protein [Rhizobium anhuiense]|nr:hypothetical protein [Rhizobium anhuiense]GGE00184.1 hypothetical protein GCM10008012_49630 [Rhizobium anhuiense]